jgi:arylsulfatase A-like enzyme
MKNPPNLIYILADDMGYGDLSCLNPESKINRAVGLYASWGRFFARCMTPLSAFMKPVKKLSWQNRHL